MQHPFESIDVLRCDRDFFSSAIERFGKEEIQGNEVGIVLSAFSAYSPINE